MFMEPEILKDMQRDKTKKQTSRDKKRYNN